MEIELVLEILQTVGICGGAIVLVIIAFFILGIGGDLGTIIELMENNLLLPVENLEEMKTQPRPKQGRRRKKR